MNFLTVTHSFSNNVRASVYILFDFTNKVIVIVDEQHIPTYVRYSFRIVENLSGIVEVELIYRR